MNIGEVPPLQNEKVSLYTGLSALLCFHSYSLGYSRYLAPILQKVDNVIHCINSYSVENAIGFPNTYTNSDSWIVLSNVCEQPVPGHIQLVILSFKNSHVLNEAKCKTFLVKMGFICMGIKNPFHINGLALSFTLALQPQ